MSVLQVYLQGRQQRRQEDAAMRQNEMQTYMQQNAQGIFQGDEGALSGLAGFDPMTALNIQGTHSANRRANASEARDAQSHAMNLQVSQARLDEIARTYTAQQRAEAAEGIRRKVAQGLASQSPEEWDRLMKGDPESTRYVGQFENRENIALSYLDLAEQLEAMQGPQPSSAEQKITRLMEVGIPREQAILIADGVLKVSRDPVSGEAQMVDARTGQPWSGANPEPTLLPEDTIADGQRENLSFGPTVPEVNYQGAFGGRGFVTNTLNAGADAIGVNLPFPENQEATTALSNLGLRTKTFMQQAFPGRASVQLMQELEKITAQPNRIFTGEQRGRDTLEQTASMIESLVIQERRKVKNPRAYTPQMRAQAQANIDALEGLLADYQSVLQNMEPAEGNQTSGGVTWRVVE